MCGSGSQGAHDEVVALADTLGAPVVHALRGKQFIEWDNPYDVGMTGLIGFSSGYHAMMSCDTLLMLGSDFPYRPFYPPKRRSSRSTERARSSAIARRSRLGWSARSRRRSQALLPQLATQDRPRFLDNAAQTLRVGTTRARRPRDAVRPGQADSSAISGQLIDEAAERRRHFYRGCRHADALGRALSDDERQAPVASVRSIMARWRTRCRRRSARRARIRGGKWCRYRATAACRCCLAILLTARQLDLPIKVVVFNNSLLGFVSMELKAAGYLDTNVDLSKTDFAAIAKGAGIFSIRVEESESVPEALQQAFAHPGPALVDVVTSKHELAMPPKIELAQAKGFSLYMMRAILSGRGDEIVELAKTNLR